jgi:UDPglucose 6-dehydrogenase
VDKDETKVRSLRRGKVPFYEPGLEELVKRGKGEPRLTFATDLPKSVKASQVIFIAVGTPQGEDGSADLQHVLGVAKDIAKAMDGYRVIVTKSTVPVGTAARVREIIRRETTHPFSVVSNPEFLKQGAAVDDFMKPDRVVVGAEDPRGAEIMVSLHKPFTRTGAPIMVMDCASAELSKYAANAILATRISFMNEVANVCELFGADVDLVRQAVGSDRRIGSSFLFPGVGYGGSCFPKDVKALVRFSSDKKYDFKILKAVESVNEVQKRSLVKKLDTHFGSVKGRTIAVWGLAFKPKTDDMREAPSIVIVNALIEKGAKVQVFDPEAMKVARGLFGNKVSYAPKSYEALRGAEALVIVTEWHEFREPDFGRMRKLMRSPVIFDGRNLYDPKQIKAQGFTYYSIGR